MSSIAERVDVSIERIFELYKEIRAELLAALPSPTFLPLTNTEARLAQETDVLYSAIMWRLSICQACKKRHGTYHCCEACNYDTHLCHFCGDNLGHNEVSECYFDESETLGVKDG